MTSEVFVMAEVSAPAGPRTLPPFRADHVGSLLRPKSLLQARADFSAGKISTEDLHAQEDAAIRDVIQLQHDCGLQTVTDGEFRRKSWHMDFIMSLDGITENSSESIHVEFHNEDRVWDYAPPA